MTLALRRAKLLDTAVVALLLIILSAVHYALLHSGRSHSTSPKLRGTYAALLIASWPFFAVGALPMIAFWFMGRGTDRSHFSSASKSQLTIVMASATLVTIGCILIAIAEIVWVSDYGFRHFHAVVLLAIVSVILLTWIAVQVALVVKEAFAVRKSLSEQPPQPDGFSPSPADFEAQIHSEDDKDTPFS